MTVVDVMNLSAFLLSDCKKYRCQVEHVPAERQPEEDGINVIAPAKGDVFGEPGEQFRRYRHKNDPKIRASKNPTIT